MYARGGIGRHDNPRGAHLAADLALEWTCLESNPNQVVGSSLVGVGIGVGADYLQCMEVRGIECGYGVHKREGGFGREVGQYDSESGLRQIPKKFKHSGTPRSQLEQSRWQMLEPRSVQTTSEPATAAGMRKMARGGRHGRYLTPATTSTLESA